MKETLVKFKRAAFVIAVVVFILALIIGGSLDYATQQFIGYGVMGVVAGIVFFGVNAIRIHDQKRTLSKANLLKKGLGIALWGALGIALADVIFTLFINPDFFSEYHQYAVNLAENAQDTEQLEQLEQQEAMREEYGNILFSLMAGVAMFLMTFFIGAIGATIAAISVSKKY